VMWTGLVWLRIGTGGELLWIRYWTFGFHEMLGNYRVASQTVLSSIELVVFSALQLYNALSRCGLQSLTGEDAANYMTVHNPTNARRRGKLNTTHVTARQFARSCPRATVFTWFRCKHHNICSIYSNSHCLHPIDFISFSISYQSFQWMFSKMFPNHNCVFDLI
jgi:hypothetical protein